MSLLSFTGTTLKNLFSKPATSEYPFVPREYPERTRGQISIEIEKCIFCGACDMRCPADAIKVDKAAKTWEIERFGCIQCSNCVLVCPKKCLHMEKPYTTPAPEKCFDKFVPPVVEEPKTPEVKPEA